MRNITIVKYCNTILTENVIQKVTCEVGEKYLKITGQRQKLHATGERETINLSTRFVQQYPNVEFIQSRQCHTYNTTVNQIYLITPISISIMGYHESSDL